MRYMMFIKHTEDYRKAEVPASLYEEMGKFIEEMTKSGNFVSGAGLQPSSAGARVRLKKGKITVMDGPFTETKELVGGYAIIDAKTRRGGTLDRAPLHGAAPGTLAGVRGRVRSASARGRSAAGIVAPALERLEPSLTLEAPRSD